MSILDGLGYFAASLVLATFCTRTMMGLRSLAIASNCAFIAYASTAHLWPILVLHAIMLPLNVRRLYEVRRVATPEPTGVAAWTGERDRRITAAHARQRIASHRRTAFCSMRRDLMMPPFDTPLRRGVSMTGVHGRAAECGISMQS